MKDIRTRLLLSAACFFLCLSIAAPVRAGKDAIRPRPPLPVNSEKVRELNNVAKLMSRSDRLLLLDNVVSFWKLRVSIGERNPKDTSRPETFGLVENGQLSPSFVARTALQLLVMASNEGIMNFPRRVTMKRISGNFCDFLTECQSSTGFMFRLRNWRA